MSLSKRKLVEETVFLFEEGENVSRVIVEILLKGRLRVSFDEIIDIAEKIGEEEEAEGLAREVALAMEDWRLMLPSRTKSRGSIAWEDRINIPRPGEIYEVPICVAFAFDHLKSEGEWSWRSSVGKYMEVIGQPHKGVLLAVVDGVLNESFLNRFTDAATIREACENHGYEENVDLLVAELKGGGVMSPCLGYSLFSRRSFSDFVEIFSGGGPLYELNKALFVLELRKH